MRFWPSFSKNVSVGLALVLFSTNVVFAYSSQENFWKERKESTRPSYPDLFSQRTVVPYFSTVGNLFITDLKNKELSSQKDVPAQYQALFRNLPLNSGTVRSIYLHPSSAKSAPAPLVFLILDIHQNYEAQKRTSSKYSDPWLRRKEALLPSAPLVVGGGAFEPRLTSANIGPAINP